MNTNKKNKIVVAVSINEDVYKLAKIFINDSDVMINSFSQYVNYALIEFNNVQKKAKKINLINE